MLYPVMKERLPGFRVNPNSPLYRGLVLAPFDPAIGRYAQDIPFTLRPLGWKDVYNLDQPGPRNIAVWHSLFRRHCAWGNGLLELPTYSILQPTGDFTFSVYCRGYPDHDCFQTFYRILNGSQTKLHFGVHSWWPFFTLNGVTINVYSSHYAVVVRYLASTNTLQMFGNGFLYSSTTVSLPDWASNDRIVAWYQREPGYIADVMYWRRALSENEIIAISDVNNIDYRLGRNSPPLLLPPQRKLWPVVIITTPQAVPEGYGSAIGIGRTQAKGYVLRKGVGFARAIGQAFAKGHSTAYGSAQVQAIGQTQAQGYTAAYGSAQVQATSQTQAQGYSATYGSAQVQAIGQTQAQGYSATYGSAQVQAIGQTKAQGYSTTYGSAQVQAIGQTKAQGYTAAYGSAQVQATGQTQAQGFVVPSGSAQAQTVGQLAAVGYRIASGYSQVRAFAAVAATGYILPRGSCLAQAIGTTRGRGYIQPVGYAAATAIGKTRSLAFCSLPDAVIWFAAPRSFVWSAVPRRFVWSADRRNFV